MLQVRNPFSLELIEEMPLGEWRFADRWLETAVRLHRNRKNWLPAFERIAILEKAAAIMGERAEALAFLIANEGGKPLIDARIEVARAIGGVKLAAGELSRLHGGEVPMDLTTAGPAASPSRCANPLGRSLQFRHSITRLT
mgnify:CR=1 FL=1